MQESNSNFDSMITYLRTTNTSITAGGGGSGQAGAVTEAVINTVKKMSGPKTLKDTIYAMLFPSHEQVCDFILKLPEKTGVFEVSDAMGFYAEMGVKQYNGMKKIFETKGDPAITKEVGQMLYDTFQDKRQMYAVYYTYFHLIADMIQSHSPEKDQLYDTIYEIAKYPLETNWNGIGDDEYGWRN